jgi:hypothetical protein
MLLLWQGRCAIEPLAPRVGWLPPEDSTRAERNSGLSGRVTDQSNKPVTQARVEVNGQETRSNEEGAFELSVPGAERYVLNISHADFADFSYISRTALKVQSWPLVRVQSKW